MMDCYDCEYAIFDYEEYREKIVVGCKIDRDPDRCGEETGEGVGRAGPHWSPELASDGSMDRLGVLAPLC